LEQINNNKNDSPHFLENYFAEVKIKNDHKSFLERIDLTEIEWSVAGTTTLVGKINGIKLNGTSF
jgi:hypothetical protein